MDFLPSLTCVKRLVDSRSTLLRIDYIDAG
jgi:hypothetical protein